MKILGNKTPLIMQYLDALYWYSLLLEYPLAGFPFFRKSTIRSIHKGSWSMSMTPMVWWMLGSVTILMWTFLSSPLTPWILICTMHLAYSCQPEQSSGFRNSWIFTEGHELSNNISLSFLLSFQMPLQFNQPQVESHWRLWCVQIRGWWQVPKQWRWPHTLPHNWWFSSTHWIFVSLSKLTIMTPTPEPEEFDVSSTKISHISLAL